jgi:hypothetical protein
MPSPTPLLQWIALAGGLVGIIAAVINLVVSWRNRRRLEFRVLSAVKYYVHWSQWELDKGKSWPTGQRPGIPVGSARQVFTVLEFSIRNEYPTEVTVGRFMIDSWMFSDSFKRLYYAPKDDYRVFDLHTRELTSLEKYVKVPAKGSYGLRVEIYQDTDGPDWVSNHSHYTVKLPTTYKVEFFGADKRHLEVRRFERIEDVTSFNSVHRWSELLEEADYSRQLPQGVRYPQRQESLIAEIRWWLRSRVNWLIYGSAIHVPGAPTRIASIIATIVRHS